MNAPLPHLNWLRTFEAAARHASFAAAAKELNLTPTAASQQIKALLFKDRLMTTFGT